MGDAIELISWLFAFASLLILSRVYLNSKHLLALFSIFLFTSIWRLIGAYQIDFSEPIKSVELGVEVGGTYGLYAVFMSIFFLIVLLAINIYFSRKKTRVLVKALEQDPVLLRIGKMQIEYIVLGALLILYISVIFEIVYIGVYPLLDNIPRWQYSREIAGVLSKYVFSYVIGFGAFLHGYLYIFFTRKTKCNSCKNIVVLLIILQQFIFVSQGHKFTTPFFTLLITFSVIGMFYLLYTNKKSVMHHIKIYSSIVMLLSFFVFLMYVVFIVNREYTGEYLMEFLHQRVFVAPNQLNFDAFQRVFSGLSEYASAFYYLFVDRLPMDSNPSVNYLMFKSMGPEALTINTSYTDAYPGIFVELFGILGGVVFAIVFAMIYVWSAYKMTLFIALGRLLPSTFFFFIFQASMQLHNQGQFPTVLLFVKLLIICVAILLVKQRPS